MKLKTYLLVLAIIASYFTKCYGDTIIQLPVNIRGQVSEMSPMPKSGKLTYFDFTRIIHDEVFAIDSSGSFNLTIYLTHPLLNVAHLEIGENYYSIHLLEPGAQYELSFVSENLKIKSETGRNSLVREFYDALYKKHGKLLDESDMYYATPHTTEELLNYTAEVERIKLVFLDEYCLYKPLPHDLNSAIRSEFRFKTAHQRIMERFDYGERLSKLRTMPTGYFTGLYTEYAINDWCDIQSLSAINYISNGVTQIIGDTATRDEYNLQSLLRNISNISRGFMRDMIISQGVARFYLSEGISPTPQEWEQISGMIDKKPVLEYLKEYNDDNKQSTPQQQSVSASNDIELQSVLEKYIQKHLGKVIYIDFYATWCSPCRYEIPYAKQLSIEMAGKDVVILNLCAQSPVENWEKLIKTKDIDGENHLLTNEEFKVLSSVFRVNAFPTYILIDKEGNVIDYNAPRPSSKKTIIEKIESLL